ncbi:hypothetical protein [Aliamphritea spongicola]|nr:hypothetical protein [Aliamphritea spongicola]
MQNRLQEKALISQSQAAGELPDPQFSFAVANLPTDSFKLDQEPMTQLIAGVSQMLPRGDSLVLRKQQFLQQSERHPLLSLDRQARLVMTVSQLWLEAYKVRQSIALIRNDRVLFDQLVDISLASYSAALGQTQQQDVVRAELEKRYWMNALTGCYNGRSRWSNNLMSGCRQITLLWVLATRKTCPDYRCCSLNWTRLEVIRITQPLGSYSLSTRW